MNLNIPLYVEEHKTPGSSVATFSLKPLFIDQPRAQGGNLGGAVSKLARELRKMLDALGKTAQQSELLPWTFSPVISEQTVQFKMQLRRMTADCRFLVVQFDAFDRRFACVPAIAGLWFDLMRGQQTQARAIDMITDHFKKLERDEEGFTLPESLRTCNRAWTMNVELDVQLKPALPKVAIENLAALFSSDNSDGRAELHKVGRCLDWLYPDGLDRVVLREEEVNELLRLLSAPDKRPVMLLGPSKVGKTAIIHETVHRRVRPRNQPHVAKENVWLISPQRLISGMSYVGQWESRLLAILKEAGESQHVLYFDDVLGLYHAGVSADSDLNVAAVMRPFVERRDFRMLAEMSPQAFQVLREKDRGLADQFHILPVREPSESQTRRILIHVTRELENTHQCRFAIDAIPTVMDFEQRHVRDAFMPGKAAGFLAQLAIKNQSQDISRATALQEFSRRTGMSLTFLDQTIRLDRNEVIKRLSVNIIGQPAALDALADVVTIAKARLNDTARPLGTFLFLGPTGVGKTQCAKALAAYLFGDAARLIRFDMNEFIDAPSLARLTGTFSQPEGLLTSAVRRQPFCVLLLDEIEKAHPDVFDLLLQVLGEGRLTDSLGRTSDFTNAIIIMTSNLGARQAQSSFGLAPANVSKSVVYTDSAKQFFRPEFFNRLDRIVPFEPLARDDIASIANQLIAGLFAREGLVHRRCVLQIDPQAMSRIIDQGFDPKLGARALKRAVEKQLSQPIAARLSSMKPDAPTIISINERDGAVVPIIEPLVAINPTAPALSKLRELDAGRMLSRIEAYINRVESQLNQTPSAGGQHVTVGDLSPLHFRQFAAREQIRLIDKLIGEVDQSINNARAPKKRTAPTRPKKPVRKLRLIADAQIAAQHLLSATDTHSQLASLSQSAIVLADEAPDQLLGLLHEIALMHAFWPSDAPVQNTDRVLLNMRGLTQPPHLLTVQLSQLFEELFSKQYGFAATRIASSIEPALLLEMPAIATILSGESGVLLLHPRHENISVVNMDITTIPDGIDVNGVMAARLKSRETTGAVQRVFDPAGWSIDLKSGLLCQGLPTSEELRRFILAGLPLPTFLLEGVI